MEQIDVPHHVMVKLAETLRQHSFQVCIKGLLTENRFSVLDITGPQDTGLYAAAIDIGTTTVSAVLAETVSYTHLVGYKRQGLNWWVWCLTSVW